MAYYASGCMCGCDAYTGRAQVRWHNEKRTDATARNLKNRAAVKERDHYKVKYPGVKTAKWPSKMRGK